jgi:endopeptidase Clp ATP-binding regulatory subunit ClpX
MDDSTDRVPDQKELEKELNQYLEKKYGDRVKLVVSTFMPKVAPEQGAGQEHQEKRAFSGIHFDMKPEELITYLNSFIVKQDEAKEILATKICTHYNKITFGQARPSAQGVGHIKNNIIMLGPTGVGKTYMIKLIAAKLGVPFVKGDATKFSETGYVGGDVEDLVRDLVHEADGDIDLAQYGIIYVDEIDKIASAGNILGPDVSRTGVQRALLKPMEETEVDLRVPHDPVSQMEALEHYRRTGKRERKTVNTKNILFIVSGAFGGLDDLIKKRLRRQGLGFGAEISSNDQRNAFLPFANAEDLIEYGFESEFIGRLPVTAVFRELEIEDLYHILKNPQSPIIASKKRDFLSYGIDLKFEDRALWALAEMAYQQRTGARGLISAIERVLLKFERSLPSTDVMRLVVTEEMVADPEMSLGELLRNPNDESLKRHYEEIVTREQDEMRDYIWSRKSEFQGPHRTLFTDNRLNLVAQQLLKHQMDLHSAFDYVLSVAERLRHFETLFQEKYGINITLDDEALDLLLEWVTEGKREEAEIIANLDNLFGPGLKLIRDRSGIKSFSIPREGVEQPEIFLDRMIKDVYRSTTDTPGDEGS